VVRFKEGIKKKKDMYNPPCFSQNPKKHALSTTVAEAKKKSPDMELFLYITTR